MEEFSMKTRQVFLAGLLISFCLWMGGCKAKQETKAPEADYTIKVGVPSKGSLCAAPFYIAAEKDFFQEEGVNVDIVKIDTNQIAQLLTTGQIDVTRELIAAMIQPIANGLDVKIPLAIHTGCNKVLVPPESEIKTPADLKGKRIGTSGMNVAATIIVQRYLAELGIGTTANNLEVEWLIYPSSELPLAMERGQVDAIAINDPVASIIENEGKGRAIIDTGKDDYLKDEYCCLLVASTGMFNEHPEALAKFTRAIQKASYYVQKNPEETALLMAEKQYVAGDPAINGRILATYKFNATVGDAETAILRNARDLQRIGLVDASVDVNALTKNTFVALPGVPDKL
jgi:NitT/TauT family transport system substrate-binding protein